MIMENGKLKMDNSQFSISTYPVMKDSGVEWIGEIPEGWEVKRFRYLFDLITDKIEGELPKIGLENIESESGRLIHTETDFEGEGIYFESGDILFGKLRPYLAKVYLADFQGKAVGDFFVFRSKSEIFANFGSKLILSQRFIEITNSSTFGAKMPRVSWDFISNLDIAYPSVTDQTTIANYLDRKTAEIDKLIAQKERLLELYEEEKTAIINQAVTKGIDPDVKLKDSGIDWLGEIPEGWEVKKLKYVANIVLGKMLTNNDKGGYEKRKYLRAANIEWLCVNVSDVKEMWFSSDELARLRIKEGDLLVSEGGEVGRSCIWKNELNECYIQNSVHKVSFANSNNSIYFLNLFFIMGQKGFFDSIVNRISIAHLTGEKLKEIYVVCPPSEEQTAIVRQIETEIVSINTKIAKTKKIIELQKEYRSALISEVVTGKIRVTQEVTT